MFPKNQIQKTPYQNNLEEYMICVNSFIKALNL